MWSLLDDRSRLLGPHLICQVSFFKFFFFFGIECLSSLTLLKRESDI
jgi:hypothetical protein